MKKFSNKLYFLISISLLILFLVITLFVGVANKWTSLSSFWTIWSMILVPTLLSSIASYLYLRNKHNSEFFTKVPLIKVSLAFEGITLLLGLILTISLSYYNVSVKWYMYMIELIILVIYIVFYLYIIFGTNYIVGNRKKIKDDVYYIRNNASKLENISISISDNKLKGEVLKLSSNIRYSDPVGVLSTKEYEKELEDIINEIVEKIKSNDNSENILILIKKAEYILSERNSELKNSK